MKRNQKGFTLMELMVVIVIVAILAAVAVPLYINYVNDARRTEAKGAIGAIITAEQTEYQRNGIYVDVGTFFQAPLTPAQQQQQILNCDLTDAMNNWTFTVTGADVNGFTVTATGQGQCAGLTQTYLYTRTGGGTWTP